MRIEGIISQFENGDCQYAIWDLDGTLLDSNTMWWTLPRRYLKEQGILNIAENLEEIIDPMTLEEAAVYMKEAYKLPYAPEEMMQQFQAMVKRLYFEELAFFPKTAELVKMLHKKGIRQCLLTTADQACAEAALKRGGLFECMEAVHTCSELGLDKRGPGIYEKTCELHGYQPEKTMVFEDADFAIQAAKQTPCIVMDVKLLLKNDEK